jgi:hypothetical protein
MTATQGIVALGTAPPDRMMVLEELKLVLEERHFVMTKYLQAITLYLVITSFALTRIADPKTAVVQTIAAILITAFNALSLVGALYFRLMAEQARQREAALAKTLDFEPTRSHVWGFWMGVGLVIITETAAWALRIFVPAPHA